MIRLKPYVVIVNSIEELREWALGKWLPVPKEYPCLIVMTRDFEQYFYADEVQEIANQMKALVIDKGLE